ncbi:hypothetical protein A3D80_03075 [Candidatus Roizmanbacteria bacterium RIFCSPHIGHO2_02_FULL_40_13b]|uniref:Uncharacterized protein n=1 Tax=Candidatus Roizmanbacteria bacterium RIFCSPHIGHO2_01_FULL_39_24 TaxID=1802032 RepID=A0A1F7GJL5_9BACT|nr:MAG: hypothetical protein A2799_02895 [Candidatus Roizmanbacteria bacterium RIFCSPHIGHO2_01_FULL_39_24]OGK27173.1 MAG: hypothetical protein A3D80_03075 [Candidatus Roizmanbacteria bacterium RIFCSPHIGHO2_02_FULL_40_13b]OGK49539.1 MAG: hypothetical protein A3A56_00035 [Candidatus Roizmanbacteria bacterium RIFCSPLOWO2_01_FULL_40_32]OGK57129.1 MAG: hypothetical protein A3H83_02170 [Candidatus Roizmanbacteria bacterium RIFCSPLOWO2_02_FULL_39_8]
MANKTFLETLLGVKSSGQNPEEILEHAHKKAEKILVEAVSTAQGILNQTELFNADLKARASAGLETAMTKQIATLGEQMEKNLAQIMASFTKKIDEELRAQAEKLAQKTNERFIATEAEIELYKKAELAKIDAKLTQKIDMLAQKLLGKSIDTKTHEKMIMDAVEKAGSEGFFE